MGTVWILKIAFACGLGAMLALVTYGIASLRRGSKRRARVLASVAFHTAIVFVTFMPGTLFLDGFGVLCFPTACASAAATSLAAYLPIEDAIAKALMSAVAGALAALLILFLTLSIISPDFDPQILVFAAPVAAVLGLSASIFGVWNSGD